MFVDKDVQPSLHLPGFTEEHKFLEQEDVALTFPPPRPDSELVLSDQLTLLLQVHLEGGRSKSCVKIRLKPNLVLRPHHQDVNASVSSGRENN